jgi:hypothetical protein
MDTKLFSRHQPGGFFAVTDRQYVPSGSVFWVHATTGTDGAGYGRNPDAPVATLDYAIGLCTANKGDLIFLMPGHAENIASATGCVLDVAGVRVVGLGYGTLRPTLTLTTADTATISITAANCYIENVLIVSNFLNIAAAVTVGALADGLTLKNVEMRNTSVILGALIQISIAAACADVTIDGFKFIEVAAAGLTAPATNVILCAGAADRFTLINSRIYCFCTAAPVALSAAASADITLENIRLLNNETGAGLGIAVHNSSTGFVEDVTTVNLKNAVKGVTGTGMAVGARVNYSNAVNAYAGLFSYTIDS